MISGDPAGPLLEGVRVIDMSEDKVDTAARILADLGADVIRVEPPAGSASRDRAPVREGVSLYFAVRNTNKRSVTIDLESAGDREKLWKLLATADIWIESTEKGSLESYGLDPLQVLARIPSLVILSASDFGRTGPYSSYAGSEPVLLALGTQLSRSGKPGRKPLLPPAGMSYEAAAVIAAWAALLAFYQREATGIGDWIDFSIFESTVEVMDPAYGTIGTATSAAQTNAAFTDRLNDTGSRDRPSTEPYPIFACKDGYVRIHVLTPRQWYAMRSWLGEPQELQDPIYETLGGRVAIMGRLRELYGDLCRERGKFEFSIEAQQRGVAVSPIMTTGEVLEADHFNERGAFTYGELAPGLHARMPAGFFEVDGKHLGFRHRAPGKGEHNDEVFAQLEDVPLPGEANDRFASVEQRLPLSGVRICDLGSVIFGAEVGRNLADMGAEVIRIENSEFPDWTRQALDAHTGAVSASFAIGHRNEKCFGLNLRKAGGAEILKRIISECDVVLSNFKPGTLERLGVGYQDLAAVNPGLIWMSASSVGHTGPWAQWLGYGPNVRCLSGVTNLWRYPDDPASFSDHVTIYPDHYAARVACLAVVAGLVRRKRTGNGADIRVSQAETVINMLAEDFVSEAADPGSSQPRGNTGGDCPWNIYQCAGDDEWCAVTVRNNDDWSRLVTAMDSPDWARDSRFADTAGRLSSRAEIDERIAAWVRQYQPARVMAKLQAAGVPAGRMVRLYELQHDEQLKARDFVAWLEQPGLPAPLPMEARPFHAKHIQSPPLHPAPQFGEHTLEISKNLLHIADDRVLQLVADGVLEVPPGGAGNDSAAAGRGRSGRNVEY